MNRTFIKFIAVVTGIAAIYFELYSFRLFFMILAITADTMSEPVYIQSSCRFHLVIMALFIYAYELLLYLISYGDQLEEEGVVLWSQTKKRLSEKK